MNYNIEIVQPSSDPDEFAPPFPRVAVYLEGTEVIYATNLSYKEARACGEDEEGVRVFTDVLSQVFEVDHWEKCRDVARRCWELRGVKELCKVPLAPVAPVIQGVVRHSGHP